MLAEHRPTGSTGGTARPYIECMRNGTIITLSLFLAPLLACGEDAPTRPEDGTVSGWDECVWDGQLVYELCEPELAFPWLVLLRFLRMVAVFIRLPPNRVLSFLPIH